MQKVNYDNFSKTFSASRQNMKWEEIDYFFDKYLKNLENKSVLDVGCGSGRLLKYLIEKFGNDFDYLGVDASAGMILEAKNTFFDGKFEVVDMMELEKIGEKKFDYVFFIASFHHLSDLKSREEVLTKLKNLLKKDSIVFMTNWALESSLNLEKYKGSKIINSTNEFGSSDFDIKIGEFKRYYHSFSLSELEYLFLNEGFEIVENRLFDNERNFISIIKIL